MRHRLRTAEQVLLLCHCLHGSRALRTVYGKLQQNLCKAALTGGVVATQAAWQEQHGSSYDQQPVYTSMAGEDGSLVMPRGAAGY